ncbi:MoaB/Mog domain-containing protein [Pilobolus umbonatus]|nr:MoaB/Mog domain-containing protein [Pilobolus umbonatus]
MTLEYSAGILIVSDTADKDPAQDKSGPLLQQILSQHYQIKETRIVADEPIHIQQVIKEWTNCVHLIIVSGGTGFGNRDRTPEAIQPLLTRETPGITHLLLSSSLKITPFAALSRPVSGIRQSTLIVTLPGSPKACKENMDALLPVLPHALDQLSSKKQTHQEWKQGHTCVHRQESEGEGVSHALSTPVSQRARISPYPLISIEEAKKRVKDHTSVLNTIHMPVSQFLYGYVLAEDVYSVEPVPGYPASIVDGYAVHVEDGPGIYPIESISLAQSGNSNTALSKGKIARVATGGIVPENANAVVMLEDTLLVKTTEDGKEELEVNILHSVQSGENIRPTGSDCSPGVRVGSQGERIGYDLGVFASVGVRHVKVYRKPRVGVMSTGNEVMDHLHTDQLLAGQIRDTNRLTLLAAVQAAGFEAIDLGIVDDTVDDIHERLEEGLSKSDLVISTGGVSMGEADFIKPILEQKLDATIHFGRVMLKPGKPTTFATVPYGKNKSKSVFGLPGNPASALVSFHLFVLPALRQMSGLKQYENTTIPVKIMNTIQLDERPEYHRVHVTCSSDGFIAQSTGRQISSRLLSMKEANGFLQLPTRTSKCTQLISGSIVPCLIIGPL